MDENPLKIRKGDVVRLRSGGQKMTVAGLDGQGADCVWVVGSQQQAAWVSFACMARAGKLRRWHRAEAVKAVQGFG